MKLLRMYVRPCGEPAGPSSLTSTQAAAILAEEFPEVGRQEEWDRLFDPNLDLRLELHNMVAITLAASAGRPLYTDGLDNAYAVVTQERIGDRSGWFISITRGAIFPVKLAPDKVTEVIGNEYSHYTVHLVLHDDDQAERIRLALAQLNPEARRFIQKEKA